MTIQQAIEKAVEGGYHRGQIGTSPIVEINCDFAITETKGERNHYGLAWVWLDPLFWQSLGKAMGWTGKAFYEDGMTLKTWKREWHRFIDKLADGGTAEQFFEELK